MARKCYGLSQLDKNVPLEKDCGSNPADMETLNMSKRDREWLTVMTGDK
jgi:hypothetical protein